MKKTTFGIGILFLGASIASAQNSVDKVTSVSTASEASAAASIASGTNVAGKLQNSLDVKNAKVGDQVVLKTTSAVKQNGNAVIAKGSTLVGRVTQVQKRAKGNTNSSIGIAFEQIQQGGSSLPINAVITSVVQANSAAALSSDDDLFASSSTSSRSTAAASSGGGLLGGVTNTVGGVANATTQTVGNVTNTAGNIVSGTGGAVTGSLRGLSISQSSSASAQGGSTLNMAGKDLRLEKGATFNLAISSSTSVRND